MDALVPIGDEGRGITAISDGERQARFDPSMSEWGNLAEVILCRMSLNS